MEGAKNKRDFSEQAKARKIRALNNRINAESHNHRKPSEVIEVPWLYAFNMKGKKKNTERSGKWLIFSNDVNFDDMWPKIKNATELGLLGLEAKVSTSYPNPLFKNGVICVYTYDAEDAEDVYRVREELRNLGVTWVIRYKEDQATLEGKYAVNGNKNISKYQA